MDALVVLEIARRYPQDVVVLARHQVTRQHVRAALHGRLEIGQHRLGGGLVVEIEDGEIGAAGGQGARTGRAYARLRSGDQSDAPREVDAKAAGQPLAGKTGTAQTGQYKNGQDRPDNSVFVGFSTGGPTSWVASALLEFSGSGAQAAAPAVRMVLEPIADGSIYQFKVPQGGEIDAEAAAEQSGIVASGSD